MIYGNHKTIGLIVILRHTISIQQKSMNVLVANIYYYLLFENVKISKFIFLIYKKNNEY